MAFKRLSGAAGIPADPEQLYRQLALVNDGPANLWLHQGDVLRSWHADHLKTPDVAIELPTGAGKTLVGGLIGEYRRRAHGERVVYLCPTRQLAKQTAEKLTQYGIPTSCSPAGSARERGGPQPLHLGQRHRGERLQPRLQRQPGSR